MTRYVFIGLFILSSLFTLKGVIEAEVTNLLTVELPEALHFLTPAGDDVALEPGIYQIETADSWLKLLPEGRDPSDVILLEAEPGNHDQQVTEAVVRADADATNPDLFHLAVLLPDGTGLEAFGTASGIRPRGSALAFLQSKMPSRSPKKPTSRPSTFTFTNPVDCGPFVNDLSQKYHTDPALAVFQGQLHLITRFSGPNLPFEINHNNNTLWHWVYANGTWSKPKKITKHTSKAGVALAVLGNQLHEVHLGRTSNKLYHSTFDGKSWTSSTEIPNQTSKIKPALAEFKGRLYMLFWDQKTNKMVYSSYNNSSRWKFPRPVHIGGGADMVQKTPAFFARDLLYVFTRYLGANNKHTFKLTNYLPNTFGDLEKSGPNYRSTLFEGETPLFELPGFLGMGTQTPGELIMIFPMKNTTPDAKSNTLTYLRLVFKEKGTSFIWRSMLGLRSTYSSPLAAFNHCVHTVLVEYPSGKLRYVKFDEDRLE